MFNYVSKSKLVFAINLLVSIIATSLSSAKSYADGLKAALVAGDIAFTNQYFNSGAKTNVGAALVELATAQTADAVTFEVLSSPNTGKLKTYRFTKGTGAGATTMDIDIEKDLLNGTFELVTITEGTGADAGKFFDGATEVGSAQGVTKAGVFMKYNSNAASDSPAYSYADMTGLVEYLTLGNQTGKVVTLYIDSATHTITADIADGAIGKAKLASGVQASLDKADSAYQLPQTGIPSTDMASAVQTSLGKADTALQSANFTDVTEAEITAALNAALTANSLPTLPAEEEEEQNGGE
jgi:hypothetical protein